MRRDDSDPPVTQRARESLAIAPDLDVPCGAANRGTGGHRGRPTESARRSRVVGNAPAAGVLPGRRDEMVDTTHSRDTVIGTATT